MGATNPTRIDGGAGEGETVRVTLVYNTATKMRTIACEGAVVDSNLQEEFRAA